MNQRFLLTILSGALLAGVCLSPSTVGAAQDEAARTSDTDDSLAVRLGYYRQGDGKDNLGGNPNIDESETVFESIILLDKTITERDRLNAQLLVDIVSSASISRYHNQQFRALQSGASGNKNFVGTLGWQHAFDAFSLGANLNFGKEYAYRSFGYGANFSTELAEKNTTLGIRFQGYNDTVKTIFFNGVQGENASRDTYTGEVSLTQILSPESVFTMAAGFTHQHGYLATSYNSVFVNGTEFSEVAPGKRWRASLTGRYKYSLSDASAVELGYRYYQDQWDIHGHTAELKYFQYLANRHLLLIPRYRFYSQDEAYFYQKSFSILPLFRTSDSDLGNFKSHTLGFNFVLPAPDSRPWWRGDVDLGFDYSLRNDDLDNFWITLGYAIRF